MTIPWNFIGHYSPEEWKELIDDWEKSNLSKNAYCQLNRIPYSSFRAWYVRISSSNSLSYKELNERWEKIVRNWEKSGLNKNAYCKAKGLNASALGRQEKKVNRHIIRKTSHEEALEKWQPIIEDWKKSDLSKFIYCRKHKLSYDPFRKWANRLHSGLSKKGQESQFQVHMSDSSNSVLLKRAPQKIEVILSQGEYFFLEGPFDWSKLMAWLIPLLKR